MIKLLLKTVALLTVVFGFSVGMSAQEGEVLLKRDAAKTANRVNRQIKAVQTVRPLDLRTGEGKVIRTGVLSKDSWITNGAQEFGMYEYPVAAYGSTCLKRNGDIDPTGGATYIGDGKYFSTSYMVYFGMTLVNHYLIDANNWTTISSTSGMAENIARDLAYDFVTGKVYGCFRNDEQSGYVFGTIDPNKSDEKRTVITSLAEAWNAISVDRYGKLYAISASGVLYEVDKGSGAMTKIGDTGLTSKYQTTGAIDPETNKFYFVTCFDESSSLYTVDLQTAKAEKVYDLTDGEQLGGMYFPASAVTDVTLSAVTNLSAFFDDATRTGVLSFVAPATYSDGSAATGKLTYTVTGNGETLASGTADCGTPVNVPVTVKASGSYVFIVTVSNEKGTGAEAYVEKYVGYDSPVAVEKVDVDYKDGRFTVSWPASTKGVYGTMFNKDDVTYSVVRMPGDVTVADHIKATSCEDAVPETTELINYRYVVTAHNHDATGGSLSSPEYLLGYKLPPYEVKFNSKEAFNELTIVDANNDGRYWLLDTDGDPHFFLYPTSVTVADDYIFSVPLMLEGGRMYKFVADMGVRYPQYGNKEKFDAFLATAPAADACISTLIEPLTISTDRDLFSSVFRVEKTGKYYVAIHGCSEPDTYGLFAFGMSVSPDADLSAPDAPALTAQTDFSADNKVDISLTAPAKLLNGEAVGDMSKMELYRDGTLLTTFDAPAAGSVFTYTDSNVENGLHLYSAMAYNASGAGKAAETKAFVGINMPGTPVEATATEQDDHRTVKVTWKAPETDVDGCPINPEIITYTVARYDASKMRWVPVAEGIKGYSFTEAVSLSTGTQVFLKYGVYAETSAGKNSGNVCAAPIVAVGDAYSMPYTETFGGTSLNGILGEENENEGASWQVWDKEDADGDGRCLFYSGAIDKAGRMFTGKIHIEGNNPVFSFWYWSIPTSENEEIVVEANDGTGYRRIGVTPMNRGGEEQHWEKYACSLKDFTGKDVQVRLTYITRKYVLYVDNLRIYDSYDNNLTVNAISVPTKMDPGTPGNIVVVIENTGEQKSGAYGVDLYFNDVKVLSGQMPELDAGKKVGCAFKYDVKNIDPEQSTFHAVIDYADDFAGDNTSEKKSTMVLLRDYPVATGLGAVREGSTVQLSWTSPELDGGNVTVTEDAEHLVPFSTGFSSSALPNDYVGDWTMFNGDGEGSNGLAGFPHDNIAPYNELGFIVFNPAEMGIIVRAWQARSGNQAFVCLCAPTGANDDWMISPLLSGNAQTVSFYAKSVEDIYNEQFEFLYSTTDTDVNSFTKVKSVSNVPVQWTEYSFEVPAGAKYFAIRCVSDRQFALFVDDITFERANPAAGLVLKGYNVYCDGVKLNASPVTGNTYSETRNGEHSYVVTAVYDRGESAASNKAVVSGTTAIEQAAGHTFTVKGGTGCLIVEGAEGKMIDVFGADGKVIDRVKGCERSVVKVAAGLYVVRVGSTAVKVAVK